MVTCHLHGADYGTWPQINPPSDKSQKMLISMLHPKNYCGFPSSYSWSNKKADDGNILSAKLKWFSSFPQMTKMHMMIEVKMKRKIQTAWSRVEQAEAAYGQAQQGAQQTSKRAHG